ncbi:MAG TPA: hypothetical protein VJI96_00800 [Candidatus Andersenbacteria bacterium]|nr:hypothetical protein [Candidatus Andersenbacteria bacterium]
MNKTFLLPVIALFVFGALYMASPAYAAIGFVPRGVPTDTPGLISGLWHGLVAPYALILSLFQNVTIYAYPNAGFIYDLGFLLSYRS